MGHILVVDDEPNAVKAWVRRLQLEGFDAQGTTSGVEALEIYKETRFDLVLLDLKMPETDGLAVLKALKEYDPVASVVILTAYGTKQNVVEALRLGACEFLEKPIDIKELVTTVQHVLDQEEGSPVRGNLRTLSLPSIVQINCTERNQAHLRLRRRGQEGGIFFEDGNVTHAVLGSKAGEEAVYEILTWEEDGVFELEMGVPSPEHTINTSWSGLLLEGMRRIDERAAEWDGLDALGEPEQEVIEMATRKRSEILAEHLETLLSNSADINGAVVVGQDGLVLASNLTLGGHDATRVGAEGAALLGLSRRTLKSLQCGEFKVAVLEGNDGWVLGADAGPRAMVLGLTDANVNLGMALLEMRDISSDVAETMA